MNYSTSQVLIHDIVYLTVWRYTVILSLRYLNLKKDAWKLGENGLNTKLILINMMVNNNIVKSCKLFELIIYLNFALIIL